MRPTRLVSLMILIVVSVLILPTAVSAQGNSNAAKACQADGYTALVGAGGEKFPNAGECVSFVAQGGTFATGIIIPAGEIATFTPYFSACSSLSYGYTIDGVDYGLAGSKPEGCFNGSVSPYQVGPFDAAVVLGFYLVDNTCGQVFSSDGTHGWVGGSYPNYQVEIADAGPGCYRPDGYELTAPPGNLRLAIAITS